MLIPHLSQGRLLNTTPDKSIVVPSGFLKHFITIYALANQANKK